MKVGFLGPEGTFSEAAGRAYLKRVEGQVELVPFTTIHSLLLAVQHSKVKEGVCPIENSIEGTIGVVTDMLAKDVNLKIRQEIILPIFHYLIAQKGVNLSEVTDVISHPQALDQCKDFLRKKLPKAMLHLSYSTADAVKQVATSLGEKIIAHGKVKGRVFAAIGNISTAKLYGIKVLASKINAAENQTRFLVLSKKDHPKTGRDKTSIIFSINKNIPGGLFNILKEFAERKINLTKIESRPSKKALGDYYFFVDMEGHQKSKLVADALKRVKKNSGFFKNLGSYPKGGK
ncbi:MAG: prephenate dehydratase [Candidatus Saganbacteria bacterium]|nr:prephenate dehydratase [Candidatus Saganbacteria bacterium]